jgi:vancomycin permeability regulator SanA
MDSGVTATDVTCSDTGPATLNSKVRETDVAGVSVLLLISFGRGSCGIWCAC